MPFSSLLEFAEHLEKHEELIRIKEFVNPDLEITEITDRISKTENGGKALLFENTGTQFPLLINAYGSYQRMCLALGVKQLDEISGEIENLFKDLTVPKDLPPGRLGNIFDKLKMLPKLNRISSWMPKLKKSRGACQENIIYDPDISVLPVLKCWPFDGGRFITLPMVITKNPHSGIRNVGMYRMQIFEKNITGMHWHTHKTGARHFNEYKKIGKRMPVAVALGGDPVYTYSATAPLPDNVDEFILAGFLRKKKVELVKCITQDIEVPSDADIIIEGYVDPDEELIWEGPFGDHTGFYSLADWYPRFHITCITHRNNAVYPATIVGIPPMEDAWIGKATERIFLAPIKMAMLPEVIDIDLPFAGVAHNICIVKIEKSFPGHALKVMNALWGAGQMMFNKILIVVDKNIQVHNYYELAKIISENTDPANDIYFSKGPLDVLDHAAGKFAFGGKMFIDGTKKYPEEIIQSVVGNRQSVIDSDALSLSKDRQSAAGIKEKFPEIQTINTNLETQGISVTLISFKKSKPNHVLTIAQSLSKEGFIQSKLLIFTDLNIDINDLFFVTWITSGNIDVTRDCRIITHNSGSSLIIDATVKTREIDNFQRDWPNVVVSANETISKVDLLWSKLNIGDFIESPSLKYIQLQQSESAIYNI